MAVPSRPVYSQQEPAAVRGVDAECGVLAVRDKPQARLMQRVRIERASGQQPHVRDLGTAGEHGTVWHRVSGYFVVDSRRVGMWTMRYRHYPSWSRRRVR